MRFENLVDAQVFGLPSHEHHYMCSCDGRTWILDKRTDRLEYRDEVTA